MSQYPNKDRRCYYRLRYPDAEQPIVRFNGRGFPVAEISEKGAKVLLPSGCSVCLDEPFAAVLYFRDGESSAIEGVVVRHDEEGMVVKLSKGVQSERMLAEQSRIQAQYPELCNELLSRVTD